MEFGEVGGEAGVLEPAAVEPGVELAEGAGVGAAGVVTDRRVDQAARRGRRAADGCLGRHDLDKRISHRRRSINVSPASDTETWKSLTFSNRFSVSPSQARSASTDEEPQIETTVDELLGYHIVKSILRDTVKPERIVHRDTRSYMGVLLDDTNRKPICRLHFNRKQRYLGLFNPEKQETRVRLDDLNDIFTHADRLRATVSNYEALDDANSRAGVTDNQQSPG